MYVCMTYLSPKPFLLFWISRVIYDHDRYKKWGKKAVHFVHTISDTGGKAGSALIIAHHSPRCEYQPRTLGKRRGGRTALSNALIRKPSLVLFFHGFFSLSCIARHYTWTQCGLHDSVLYLRPNMDNDQKQSKKSIKAAT